MTDCADYETASLTVRSYTVSVEAGTNPVTIVPCRKGECEEACRRKYREGMGGKSLVAMSNTWGDRNRDSRICEAFVMKEIDAAAELGLDIVQIDDGWQWKYTYDPADIKQKLGVLLRKIYKVFCPCRTVEKHIKKRLVSRTVKKYPEMLMR